MSVTPFLQKKLTEIFGFSHFRGAQESIMQSLLDKKNTLVIMPTGAGKSLCYQLPAMVSEGTAIIISPLIALMKNQVDQLNSYDINARFLNSTLSKSEIQLVKDEVLTGKTKLLYIAPESLVKEGNLVFLKKAKLSFIAIDEAHCISEWGHDFRPEYRKIANTIEELGNLPVIALTATATEKVELDILKNLQLTDVNIFKTSFNRPNLYYEIQPKKDSKKQLIRFIKNRKGKSGIVYCLSRKRVEEIAELLVLNNVKALPYHAKLEPKDRVANQEAFLKEKVDVIVATIAFGMGIDKPDVRFVVHFDAPKSIEGYYQETGRTGRDGLEGNCLMLFSQADIEKLDKFNKDKSFSERENARMLTQEMAFFATLGVCRRKQLLAYFGEYLEKDCNFCDNCTQPTEKFKGEKEASLLLEAIQQTNQRFDNDHVIDLVLGIDTDHVLSYEHTKLPCYGKAKAIGVKLLKGEITEEETIEYWYSLLKQLMIGGFIQKDIENPSLPKLTSKGLSFIAKPYPIVFSLNHNYQETEKEEDILVESTQGNSSDGINDKVLFEMLKTLRKKIAHEINLPPYIVFQDPSLEEMTTSFPTTVEDLAQINGVGLGKAQKYGKPFVELISKYVKDNEIDTEGMVVVKGFVNKSKTKIVIIKQIDRKIDLDELAESLRLSLPDLLTEIEHICYSGTKLNLNYYINKTIDKFKQDEIYQYFRQSNTDNITIAMNSCGIEEVEEMELRLMRIKFLSEFAS